MRVNSEDTWISIQIHRSNVKEKREMGSGRHDACQGANVVLNLGDNTGGPGDLSGRMFDGSHSVEAKGLGVREPVH